MATCQLTKSASFSKLDMNARITVQGLSTGKAKIFNGTTQQPNGERESMKNEPENFGKYGLELIQRKDSPKDGYQIGESK